jgi:hypothetical protein
MGAERDAAAGRDSRSGSYRIGNPRGPRRSLDDRIHNAAPTRIRDIAEAEGDRVHSHCVSKLINRLFRGERNRQVHWRPQVAALEETIEAWDVVVD